MHRDYDEEEYRDDELYHYGKTGMKWGHHIYAMVKATAKKAARSASKNLKAGGKFLKENPEFAYGVALPAAAFAGRATYQAIKKHNRNAEKYQDRFLKAVNEVDRLYQIGTPNEKKLKRLVDVAWDG